MKMTLNIAVAAFFWTASVSYSQNFPDKKPQLLEKPEDVVLAIQSAAEGKTFGFSDLSPYNL